MKDKAPTISIDEACMVQVLGIPWDVDSEGLREYISKYGELEYVIAMKDRSTGQSRGFGYVTFSSVVDAKCLLKEQKDPLVPDQNDSGEKVIWTSGLVFGKGEVYMTYVQALYGGGGWPFSVFPSPNLKPLMGGTYFPPNDKYGRPGFKMVLRPVSFCLDVKF